MGKEDSLISEAFKIFMLEAPEHAQAWSSLVQDLAKANALDPKTTSLAYLAVLASAGLLTGIPFHVQAAKEAGAARAEVISAILIGLPAVGNRVTQALPAAIRAFGED
ncbi:MAG: carboxymuconolactone decarboxylase family protein [Chloroflexota bacterium]|nr:MAG: carboxymuconolactone decarboxylase family protein [Chloroflexota bacterium]